jgi:hypothetical protein
MSEEISGPFDVIRSAEAVHEKMTGLMGRHALEKTYHGDLSAIGIGEMLSAGGTVAGSAGYVAIEKVEGALKGRKGTFYLQHTGLMNRGQPSLSIVVIPDSGTDELTGLTGTLDIVIAEGGKHSYRFAYDL